MCENEKTTQNKNTHKIYTTFIAMCVYNGRKEDAYIYVYLEYI